MIDHDFFVNKRTYQFKLRRYFFGLPFLVFNFEVLTSNFKNSIVPGFGAAVLGTFTHIKTKLVLKNKLSLYIKLQLLLFLGAICIRHSLDGISVLTEIHDWHSGDLSDSPLEVLITGGHYVRLVLGDAVHETVISVCSLVHAGQPHKPGVLDYPQSYSVFASQLL